MGKNWPMVPLGEILTERRELLSIDSLVLGEIPIVAKIGFDDGKIQFRSSGETKTNMIQIRPGDLVVSGINAAKGAIAIYDANNAKPIAATIHYGAYITNKERVNTSYLWWLLRSATFKQLLLEYVPGGIKTELKAKRLLSVPVPCPTLSEQQRTVTRIEELATVVNAANILQQQSIEETNSLFASAINQVWKNQTNWSTKSIGELVSIVSGQVDPQIEPYASLPHVNGEVIESGTCRLLPCRLAKDDGVKSGKFHFKAGTLLYSKIRPYLKKSVQVPFEGICSADIYAFESIDKELEPRFFMYALISPQFTDYANSLSGRTRMPKLNQKQLLAYQMSYPPLPEQRRIVAYLDELQAKIDGLKKLQAEAQKELDSLLSSILNKAFNGEL